MAGLSSRAILLSVLMKRSSVSVGRRWVYTEFLVSFTSAVVDGAYQLVKPCRNLPSTPKYFGVVGTLPVKTAGWTWGEAGGRDC